MVHDYFPQIDDDGYKHKPNKTKWKFNDKIMDIVKEDGN